MAFVRRAGREGVSEKDVSASEFALLKVFVACLHFTSQSCVGDGFAGMDDDAALILLLRTQPIPTIIPVETPSPFWDR